MKIEKSHFIYLFVLFVSGFNVCQFNPEHELFACGSVEVKEKSNFSAKNESFLSIGSCRML